MKNGPLHLLIVEDEAAHVEAIRRAFDQAGVKTGIQSAGTLREYRERIAAQSPDLVLMDLNMPDGRATENLTHPAADAPFPILVMTAFGNEQTVVEVMKAGALDYLVKSPEAFAAMPRTVERALREWDLLQKHKRAEAVMIASEVRYRRLFEAARDGILILNAETGRIVDANPFLVELLGYSRDTFVGKQLWELGFFKDIAASKDKFHELQARGYVRYENLPLETSDGRRIEVEFISNVYLVERYRVMQCNIRDITERVRAEASHARLAMAVEHAAETIVITDQDGAILYANPAFEKTSGYTRAEVLGQNPRLLKSGKHDAEFYRRMWATLSAGQVWRGDMINKRKDGTLYEEDVNISPVRDAAGKIVSYVSVNRDVTEQKKLEMQARRTQRLESIGTLAGGVAHDLNNALAPIMMAGEMLRLEFPDTATRYLELIQSSAQRAADMVRQLLTFAKGVEGERLLLEPRQLLKEMEKLIHSTFLNSIKLRTHHPKDLWPILGDATQLHQVLLNLCVNARDAMPEGGTLTLEAENIELDAAYARTVPEAKPGRYVVWRVRDTGTGISPEVLARIFDPFFTTKGPDKGTGLGLSTTVGIVKSHGGFIQVYSQPGQGSTFAVYLPASSAAGADTVLLPKADTDFRGHGETLLVVDDEPAVRHVLRAVLTKFNFKVLTAEDGTAAMLQVAEHSSELRAVITDLHMPNMDGLSFVRVLKGRLPGVGIIVASGRMEEVEGDEFKQLGVQAVIEKPFTQEKLVETLKTVFQK